MAYHIDVNKIRVWTVILDVFPDIYKGMIDNWFPPATVERMIKTDNGKFLKKMTLAEKKVIQSLKCSQYMKVDGALMYKIIRYFKLIQEPTKGWDKVPEANHINQGDDAERMRKLRNDYVHNKSSTVSDEKFHDFFNESIEIAGRLDLAIGRLVNGFKEQVTNLKTSVIDDSVVEREKKSSTEKIFFTIDSESGRKPTGVKLYYGNDISDQLTSHENEEIGSDEYTLRLLIDGKAECQKIVDYVKKYPEACSSPAIQIKDAEQGSIILHISIDRKSFTSCEILHNEIQLFIKTIFHHEEIQRTKMSDFDMVLAITDYTEQGSHDRGTICSDHSYLTEEMSDPWNNKGVKLYLTIPKKTFAERTDFYLHMDSTLRAVMSATTIDISVDKPIHAIFMKRDRKEVSGIEIKTKKTSVTTTEVHEVIEEGSEPEFPMTQEAIGSGPEYQMAQEAIGSEPENPMAQEAIDTTSLTDPDKMMIKWRNEVIKFAVTGRSGMGKSTFINLVRDVYPGEPTFAEVGFGDCTMIPTEYKHPRNEHITFTDLPGFGTDTVTKKKFLESIELSVFDFVFIFIDSVIMEDDIWVVKILQALGTKYCFIRSKIDSDILNAKDMGKTGTEVIKEIRKKLETKILESYLLKGSRLFLISNKKRYFYIGDIGLLFSFIADKLPKDKSNALLFFLPILSPEMIETKFHMLQQRIELIAFRAAVVSAIPVPFLDTAINLIMVKKEIKYYIETFLLDKEYVAEVPDVQKRNFSEMFLENIVTTGLATTAKLGMALLLSQVDSLIPVIGIAIAAKATSIYVRAFLSKALLEMKNDAIAVYEHYTKH